MEILSLLLPLLFLLVVGLVFAILGAILLFHPRGEEAAVKYSPWQIAQRQQYPQLTVILDKIKGLGFLPMGLYILRVIALSSWSAVIEQYYGGL